jgi:O-antigen/teichoic acid export membrane protein
MRLQRPSMPSRDGAPNDRDLAGTRHSYGSGLGHGASSFIANTLLALITSVVVARLYGVNVIGEFALAGAPAGAVWLLSTVREQPALMRRLTPLAPREELVTGLFAAVLAFSTALTTVVSVLAGLLTWVLFAGPIGHPSLILPAEAMLAASLLFVNTCWNFDTVLGAFRAGRPLLLSRLHQALLYMVLAVGLSFAMPTVWGLIIAWYASWATSLVQRILSARAFMRLRVGRPALREGFATLPELLRFGLRLTPGLLAEGVSDEAGIWILGALAPIAAVGSYSRAWTIARRGLELEYRVTEMLFPTLVERRLEEDRTGYDRALVDSLRYVAVAMLLPAAVAAGAAAPIMGIYGPGFAAGAGAFAYLAFVPGVVTLSAVQSQALFAEDRGLGASLYGLARAAATVLSGVLLGACAQLLPLSARLPQLVHGRLAELWRPRDTISLLGASASGFVVARLLSIALSGLSALALAPMLGLAAAGVVFVVVGGVQTRDRERARVLSRAFGAGPRAAPQVASDTRGSSGSS